MEEEEKEVNLRMELGPYHRLGHSSDGCTLAQALSKHREGLADQFVHLVRIEHINARVTYRM